MQPHDNDKRVALLAKLNDQVRTLQTSEGWKSWLRSASLFRSYSLRNQLLIASQRPSATQVAGFTTWKKLGRHVMRGEQGIAILAPCIRRIEDEETGTVGRALAGFKVVHVFDVSQTAGDDLPVVVFPEVVSPDASLFASLVAIAEAEGFSVNTAESSPNGARGWWNPTEKAITIVDGYSVGSQTRTMLHELAHAFDPEALPGFTNRAERELLAESAAYLVGTALGIDMDEASTVYVASWAANQKELEALAAKTLALADRLELALSSLRKAEVAA